MAALTLGFLVGCTQEEAYWLATPLTGSPIERAQFEGNWYDREGQLWVIVSGGPHPRLDLRQSMFRPIVRLENARTAGRELRFAVLPAGEEPEPLRNAVLRLTLADEGELRQIVTDSTDACCLCGNACAVQFTRLARNPSPVWFGRITARHAGEILHEMRDLVLEQLAHVL
jgi:hypothetical protein